MSNLIEKLQIMALRAKDADASIIEEAIDRIQELETKLNGFEDDVTDWKFSVEQQMKRGNNS